MNSIGYLNNSMYVFTNFNVVFNLDLNLNYKGSIPLKDYNGDVYVYSESKDELIFYSLYTFTPVNNDKKLFMKIDKSGQCVPYYIKKNKDQLTNLYQMPQGQAGYEIQVGQKIYFQTNNFAYEIPESFRRLNDYTCIDIDYSDKYVAFFRVNDKKIEITVYEY